MLVSEFDYELPEELIAQYPTDERDYSKMLVINPQEHTTEHAHFFNIVDFLDENCVLSSTIPRLFLHDFTERKIPVQK